MVSRAVSQMLPLKTGGRAGLRKRLSGGTAGGFGFVCRCGSIFLSLSWPVNSDGWWDYRLCVLVRVCVCAPEKGEQEKRKRAQKGRRQQTQKRTARCPVRQEQPWLD